MTSYFISLEIRKCSCCVKWFQLSYARYSGKLSCGIQSVKIITAGKERRGESSWSREDMKYYVELTVLLNKCYYISLFFSLLRLVSQHVCSVLSVFSCPITCVAWNKVFQITVTRILSCSRLSDSNRAEEGIGEKIAAKTRKRHGGFCFLSRKLLRKSVISRWHHFSLFQLSESLEPTSGVSEMYLFAKEIMAFIFGKRELKTHTRQEFNTNFTFIKYIAFCFVFMKCRL